MDRDVGGLTGADFGREKRRSARVAQRLPRLRLGNRGRHRRIADLQAQEEQLRPGLLRTTTAGREGADRRRAGGQQPGDCDAFPNRPIQGDWPYLWIDATYLKVRQNGRIVSVAITVAVGNSDGRREVLGMAVGASEAETFCTDFLRSLARRGVRGDKLVISDAHEGFKASVSRVVSATWQRCRVHFARSALVQAGESGRRIVSALIAPPSPRTQPTLPRCSDARSSTSSA